MAITKEMYSKLLGTNTMGRARKADSDMVMAETWWNDIQAQTAYCYDYSHDIGDERFFLRDLHPDRDANKTPIAVKFIRHELQSLNKDPVSFWLQFMPGQECNLDYYSSTLGRYRATWPVGLYFDIRAEDGKYNKWLCVNTANYWGNQFPTYQILPCDYVFQWIHDGYKYECPGVLSSQNSQVMRFTLETVYRKFLNFWEDFIEDKVYQKRSRIYSKRSTSKVGQVPENRNHLSRKDMVLMCSKLIGDYKKIILLLRL